MRVRWIMLVLAGCMFIGVLAGCTSNTSGTANSGDEMNESEESAATEEPSQPEETTQVQVGPPPIAVGEQLAGDGFEFRLLETRTLYDYLYLDSIFSDNTYMGTEGISEAGKFILASYSVRNISGSSLSVGFDGTIQTVAEETYEEADLPYHPNALRDPDVAPSGGFELAPRETQVAHFIFDVPDDVEAESLYVRYVNLSSEDGIPMMTEAQQIDLGETASSQDGPQPDEVLALQYEYNNMQEYDWSYDLFAEESKQQVSKGQYLDYFSNSTLAQIDDYSFSDLRTEGDLATVRRVISGSTVDGDYQEEAEQQFVLDDAGWRIVMRPDQIATIQGQE